MRGESGVVNGEGDVAESRGSVDDVRARRVEGMSGGCNGRPLEAIESRVAGR